VACACGHGHRLARGDGSSGQVRPVRWPRRTSKPRSPRRSAPPQRTRHSMWAAYCGDSPIVSRRCSSSVSSIVTATCVLALLIGCTVRTIPCECATAVRETVEIADARGAARVADDRRVGHGAERPTGGRRAARSFSGGCPRAPAGQERSCSSGAVTVHHRASAPAARNDRCAHGLL